jgi:hypothetical protein
MTANHLKVLLVVEVVVIAKMVPVDDNQTSEGGT